MEHWINQAIVLNARPHGEGGAIVSLLTEGNGRHAGYLHGGASSKKRHLIEPGTIVRAEWQSRLSENLGSYDLEVDQALSGDILNHSLKLAALQSACILCHEALPEREGHAGLFNGLVALMEAMDGEYWGVSCVMWEIQLLRELGFHLELDKCAGQGDAKMLTHVSPKTGRAVSAQQAEPYKDKLLELPNFLRPDNVRVGEVGDDADILKGLEMTGYFMEHWAFTHHTQGVPKARILFYDRYKSL
ncbi:MAG: DNA repair protein RecO [Pseudomonadota bacterium]